MCAAPPACSGWARSLLVDRPSALASQLASRGHVVHLAATPHRPGPRPAAAPRRLLDPVRPGSGPGPAQDRVVDRRERLQGGPPEAQAAAPPRHRPAPVERAAGRRQHPLQQRVPSLLLVLAHLSLSAPKVPCADDQHDHTQLLPPPSSPSPATPSTASSRTSPVSCRACPASSPPAASTSTRSSCAPPRSRTCRACASSCVARTASLSRRGGSSRTLCVPLPLPFLARFLHRLTRPRPPAGPRLGRPRLHPHPHDRARAPPRQDLDPRARVLRGPARQQGPRHPPRDRGRRGGLARQAAHRQHAPRDERDPPARRRRPAGAAPVAVRGAAHEAHAPERPAPPRRAVWRQARRHQQRERHCRDDGQDAARRRLPQARPAVRHPRGGPHRPHGHAPRCVPSPLLVSCAPLRAA